jgi:hypothetical protein
MRTRKRKIENKSKTRKNTFNPATIPIVVICWNELTYIKNMVDQLKHYNHPIILLDNHSRYEPLLEYYKEIKKELGNKIEIRMLKKNYGNTVYLTLKYSLPKVYILTDPDLELNKNMPKNFVEILYDLSEKYKVYKIGSTIEKIKKDDLINCPEYGFNWTRPKRVIKNDTYKLYHDWVDTTFCLVNTKYQKKNLDLKHHYMNSTIPAIRIGGEFSVKHLPWYKDSLSKIPKDELYAYVKNAKSSTLVSKCIAPRLKHLSNIYTFNY